MVKKAILITVSIIDILVLSVWLLMKSNGYEIPKKDKFPTIPYFPATTNSAHFSNMVLDTMQVINYYANNNAIFLNYAKTKNIYDTTFITLVNHSFKNLAYRILDRKDHFKIDTVNQLLFIFKHYTLGKYSKCERINLKNGNAKIVKLLDEKGFRNLKNQLSLVKHATNASHDTDLLIFEKEVDDYFFMQGNEANTAAKTLTITEEKNFTSPFGIKIGGDTEIKHHNINLFDKVVTGNSFKRLLSIPTPSSNGSLNDDRMVKNAGYLENKGWFDKDRIYYFKMKLKTREVKFKTDIYYISDVYFDQLNTPKSDQDTLFYFSKDKIYKFYRTN